MAQFARVKDIFPTHLTLWTSDGNYAVALKAKSDKKAWDAVVEGSLVQMSYLQGIWFLENTLPEEWAVFECEAWKPKPTHRTGPAIEEGRAKARFVGPRDDAVAFFRKLFPEGDRWSVDVPKELIAR